MRAVVVINPVAGPGRRSVPACASLARSVLGARGYDVTLRVTTAPADAASFARDAVADGVDLVVAWGGDGTVNGVGAALAGTSVPLGIVPAGSGNGLARDLGLPRGAEAALEVAASGRGRRIDAGDVGGSLFFNVAGVGLDARIAARLAQAGARRGLAGYVAATLSELRRYEASTYTIDLAAPAGGAVERIERRALFIAFANSRQYGNGAQIAPQARLDDGALDVVVVEPRRPLQLLAQVPSFFRGTLRDGAGIVMRQAESFCVTADRPIAFHVDGEPRSGGATLEVRTCPAALCIRVR